MTMDPCPVCRRAMRVDGFCYQCRGQAPAALVVELPPVDLEPGPISRKPTVSRLEPARPNPPADELEGQVAELEAVADALAVAEGKVAELLTERRRAVEKALLVGVGPSAIARALGISRARLDQLRKSWG